MKLVDMDDRKPALENVDRGYLARRDRWVQTRLGLIRGEGGAGASAAIDKALAPRLEEARMDTGVEGLERFLGYFDGQPLAAAARAELLERRMQAENVLGAEMLLTSAADLSDRKAQAALLADMASLNVRASRTTDAAACYRQLERQSADVPFRGGMTPAAWLAALPGGDALRKEIHRPVDDWSKGKVESGGGGGPITGPYYYGNRGLRNDMVFGGPTKPYFNDYTDCAYQQPGNQLPRRLGPRVAAAVHPLGGKRPRTGFRVLQFRFYRGAKRWAPAAGLCRNQNLRPRSLARFGQLQSHPLDPGHDRRLKRQRLRRAGIHGRSDGHQRHVDQRVGRRG